MKTFIDKGKTNLMENKTKFIEQQKENVEESS